MKERPEDILLFSVAGARGIVGSGLNVEVATRLALAFSSTAAPGAIVVGRDTRPSGESLQMAVMGAVTATGRECIDVGIATTPTVEMMVERLGAAGGIVVTASHNPAEWNALKFLDDRGIFIDKAAGEKLHDAYSTGSFDFADARGTGLRSVYEQAARDHIDAILSLHTVNVDEIKSRGFHVVLDCINGAGSVIAPDFLQALGVRVTQVNCKSDGDFCRDPEPRAENLKDLANRVRSEGADIGFALDPDADRLALVDGGGQALSEELTLALAAHHVLGTEKKGPIVVNMSTSALIDWIGSQHHAKVLRTPVGEAHVVEVMLRERAPIGGEGNGGVIYPELHPGRDAILGMALVLQLLAASGLSLRQQIQQYPSFYMTKEKLPKRGKFSPQVISRLIRDMGPARIDAMDGVKAIFDDGWFHVRVSNTEGVVRIIAEAMSQARTAELQSAAREALESSWDRVG